MQALTISNLSKTYSTGLEALKGIDLVVNQGDFFALLGPNGAGKSTTINIISSLVRKSTGKVTVFNYDLEHEAAKAKSCVGIVPQETNFNQFETVLSIVLNQAGFYGIPRKTARKRAKHYLTKLGLWDRRDSAARTLSGGMKRRLMIARALLHEPQLLILDEPTAGVDLEIRRSTWQFLQEINARGITIILTTHYLEEAEHLCNRVAIINQGEILESSSMKKLIDSWHYHTVILELEDPMPEMISLPDVKIVERDRYTLELTYSNTSLLNDIFTKLTNAGVMIKSMRNKVNRLEELFINLVTGK